jgi:hypothetical protein
MVEFGNGSTTPGARPAAAAFPGVIVVRSGGAQRYIKVKIAQPR